MRAGTTWRRSPSLIFLFRCEPSSCPQGHYIYVGGTRKKALLLALSVEEIYNLKHGFPPPKFARSNNALEKKNPLFMSGGGRSIKKHWGRGGYWPYYTEGRERGGEVFPNKKRSWRWRRLDKRKGEQKQIRREIRHIA